MDPKGLSGGLALWWRDQEGVVVLVKCKNLIDMEIKDAAGGLHYRMFWTY